MYTLGLDIGSSSIKAAIVKVPEGKVICRVQYPTSEMHIMAKSPGWAEQDPEQWWSYTQSAVQKALEEAGINGHAIQSIGIAYQMHGLVLMDRHQQVLRPSIIWCDSRAVSIGRRAFEDLGPTFCLEHYLNSPGNFTASKLRWVRENEPEVYEKVDKVLLPGDFIAMKLTGEIQTTVSGLSEGIFWDFPKHGLATDLCRYYGVDASLFPEIVPSIGIQGRLKQEVAAAWGLKVGTPVTYRAGDQPNNALSLGVLHPGEVAATGGTSGVVFGVVDDYLTDPRSRINGFAHVNHHPDHKRIGLLLCINGAGIQYAWLKKQMEAASYPEMENQARKVPIGSEGVVMLPFGNGAERMLDNRDIGAQIHHLAFNRHGKAHVFRAALEGIAFSFVYGFRILQQVGMPRTLIKVGNDNLFQSAIFSETIAHLLQTPIEIVDTSGAVGAAKASGVAVGLYANIEEAVQDRQVEHTYTPGASTGAYTQAYERWVAVLDRALDHHK